MEVNYSTNTTTTAGAVASFCDPTQMPMTMLMMGFATSWDPAWGCLVFLFQNFNINSVGSLILTYVITLALALFEHGVDFGRKILRQRNDAGNICFTIIDSTLYALKLGAAYLLMLVAMTSVLQPGPRAVHISFVVVLLLHNENSSITPPTVVRLHDRACQ